MRNQVNGEEITQPQCSQASIYSPSVPNQRLLTLQVSVGEKCWRASNPDWVNARSPPGWKDIVTTTSTVNSVRIHAVMCVYTDMYSNSSGELLQEHTTIRFVTSWERNDCISWLGWKGEIAIIHASPARAKGAISCRWQEQQLLAFLPWCLSLQFHRTRRGQCVISFLEEDFFTRSPKDMLGVVGVPTLLQK